MSESIEKLKFINWVAIVIQEHPDWIKDLIGAAQEGINMRLEKEISEKNDVAYSFCLMVETAPKTIEKFKSQLQKGLIVLSKVFHSAPIQKTIDKYINWDEVEEK